ncbi:hypothetical protein LCGC14_2312970, partial [marine sediment metagenome]
AYKRFLELSDADRNFALMTLTLDTHLEGRPSDSCDGITYGDGSNPILNTIACSDRLITDFVKSILDSPHASDTVIVIASDHLSMRNAATELISQMDRTNMFMVIEPEPKPNTINKQGSTLDIGSTILPFIGFKGNIGLGRNLADEKQSDEEIKYIQENIASWHPDIKRLWAFPKITESITINIQKSTLHVGNNMFYMPAFVELTPDLETTFKYNYYSDYNLLDYVQTLDEKSYYLLFDSCRNTNRFVNNIYGNGLCIIAGKAGQYRDISSIVKPAPGSSSITLSPADIRFLTGMPQGKIQPLRIAHAGGAVGGKNDTNSFDALNHNINKGFTYFELDFNFTSDGQLACIHDWEGSFKRQFGFDAASVPSLKEFKRLVKDNSQFDICTLESLIPWLKEHPTAKIVTDVKGEENIRALRIMAERIPDFGSRVIPQIYYPESYSIVKDIGFEDVIWTLYRYKGSNNDVLKWADKFKGRFAITMPEYRAKSTLPILLAKEHIPTYVHTINERERANFYLNFVGITELYTDLLRPGASLAYSMPSNYSQ